jgi:hypothetical protein
VGELISTIKLIKSADFKMDDVNIDIHKRVAAAIAQAAAELAAEAGAMAGMAEASAHGFLAGDLAAVARDDSFEIFNRPDRLIP